MHDLGGGYDDGYSSVSSFWGMEPASLVRALLNERSVAGLRILDIGAGEGKNAVAFARAGASVDAVECSRFALLNAQNMFGEVLVNWIEADVSTWFFQSDSYDIVVSYGLTHCMGTRRDAQSLLRNSKDALKSGGTYLLVAFNDGPHDLSAHPGFAPLLLPHGWYTSQFDGWKIDQASNSILHETHPHNDIPHFHSMTRIRATKP